MISALLFLFWAPSDKSWLSRMQGSVVLIFAFSWCYDLLSVNLGSPAFLFPFFPPSFRCCLCCTSNYLPTYLCFMVFRHTPAIAFSPSVPRSLNSPLLLALMLASCFTQASIFFLKKPCLYFFSDVFQTFFFQTFIQTSLVLFISFNVCCYLGVRPEKGYFNFTADSCSEYYNLQC